MFCTKCGQKVEDNVKFCTRCGDQNAADPQVENVVNESTSQVVSVQLPQVTENSSQVSVATNKQRRYTYIAGGILVAIVIGFLVVTLLTGKDSNKGQLLYIKDNALNFRSVGMKNSIEITSKIENDTESAMFMYGFSSYKDDSTRVDSNNSKLFYLSNLNADDYTGSLYVRDLNQKKRADNDERGTNLASNVISFNITARGDYAVYMKSINDEFKLYIHDLTDETLVDRNVSTYEISKDGKLLLYTVHDEDSSSETLYMRALKKVGEKTKIDSDIYQIATASPDFSKIYYYKVDEDKDYNARTLYLKETGKDKTKVISNLNSLESFGENGRFYFTRVESESSSLYDIVDDDLLSSDEQLSVMPEPIEPSYADYQKEIAQEDDWTGSTYYETVTDYDAYYIAYDQYQTAYDEYISQYEVYQEKLSRDELRDELKSTKPGVTKLSLYLFDGTKEQLISGSVNYTMLSSADYGIAIYNKINQTKMNKVALSMLQSTSELEEEYQNQYMPDPALYVSINGGEESELLMDHDRVSNLGLNSDGTKLFFIETKEGKEMGDLYVYSVKASGFQDKKVIDQDVSSYYLAGNRIYYFRDSSLSKGTGELYVSMDGVNKRIASGVQMGYIDIFDEGSSVIFFTDYNEKNDSSTLNIYQRNQTKKLADDVNNYVYVNENLYYYLSDYNTKNEYGDLWEYRGSDNNKMIDDHVNYIFDINNI